MDNTRNNIFLKIAIGKMPDYYCIKILNTKKPSFEGFNFLSFFKERGLV
jgi:hypothetical protein